MRASIVITLPSASVRAVFKRQSGRAHGFNRATVRPRRSPAAHRRCGTGRVDFRRGRNGAQIYVAKINRPLNNGWEQIDPVALITGANRGLGLEFTRQYINDGWRVFAACRDPACASELQRLAKDAGGKLAIVAMDVTELQERSRGSGATQRRRQKLSVNEHRLDFHYTHFCRLVVVFWLEKKDFSAWVPAQRWALLRST